MNRGFTFIEVLVSLAVIAALTAVILPCYAGVIRAEEQARRLRESSLLAGRIAAEVWLGAAAPDMAGTDDEAWSVRFAAVPMGEGSNAVVWYRWTLAPSNRPSLELEMFLRQGSGPLPPRNPSVLPDRVTRWIGAREPKP